MSILKYLQSKKIIPTKDAIIKSEAKRMAKRVTSDEFFLVKMSNTDISFFANEFREQVEAILLARRDTLRHELNNTEEALHTIK